MCSIRLSYVRMMCTEVKPVAWLFPKKVSYPELSTQPFFFAIKAPTSSGREEEKQVAGRTHQIHTSGLPHVHIRWPAAKAGVCLQPQSQHFSTCFGVEYLDIHIAMGNNPISRVIGGKTMHSRIGWHPVPHAQLPNPVCRPCPLMLLGPERL
jgi:hypothetical protein